jgi:hypothetical protein
MPRRSPEAIAGSLYRAGGAPPSPPKGMSAEAAKYWRQLAASRPADWLDQAGQVLLARLCRTLETVDRVHNELDAATIGSPRATGLIKEVAQLNASVKALMVALRLTPQSAVDWDRTGQRSERRHDLDPLLGGFALQRAKRRPARNGRKDAFDAIPDDELIGEVRQ